MIAQLAAINHWSLAEIQSLPFDEMCRWHLLAVETWNRMNGAKGG